MQVRENIFEQLVQNPGALYALANDPSVLNAPVVLQSLLVRVLRMLGCDSDGSKKEDQNQNQSQGKAAARRAGA